ncbi:MAG TPA: glycerol-3-phosphate acyltransferase [Candidatus Saccharimonadales bacterium]|nr:glycerol-3-phosphate acyltransferase [Candidatus Saccharimonadales bacterium]
MGPILPVTVTIGLAYLGGSVSFPFWIARARGVDLRQAGSRKLGGSNLAATAGLGAGIAGGLLDAAKGPVAVLLPSVAGLPTEVGLACGIAAVCGQAWPVFHRFDGGRANATGWGQALAVDPVAFVIMLLPLVAALVLRRLSSPPSTRLLPLAALLSFAVFPGVIWEQEGATPAVRAGLVVLGVIVVRRLSAGLREDLATGASAGRILSNRLLYDRSELQERGVVGIS